MLHNKGMTLVEVIVALLISTIIFLALLQSSIISIDYNMRNTIRDEAVGIAEKRINEAKNLQFNSTSNTLIDETTAITAANKAANCPTFTPTTGTLVTRSIKGVDKTFCSNRDVSEIGGDGSLTTIDDSDTRQVTITVGWTWKGSGYTHSVTTIVRKQSVS